MAKSKSKEVAKVENETTSLTIPDFMAGQTTGTEEMSNFIRPPVMKIIQKSAKSEYTDLFDIGSVITNPTRELIAKEDVPFTVTPLFFFPEWTTMNPLALSDLPVVHDRSFDPKSRIAVMSRNKNTWFEPIEGTMNQKTNRPHERQHVENLNFVCMVHGIPHLSEIPIVFTFCKGRWKDGSKLAAMLKARKAPIFGCIMQLTSKMRTNPQGQEYWGLDVENPSDGPAFVQDEDQFKQYQELHEKYVENFEKLEIDYSDPKESETDQPIDDM